MARSTVKASFTGLMAAVMLDNSTTIKYAVRAPTSGLTDACLKALGQTIRWMVSAFSLGLMGASTSVNIRMTTNMERASTLGRMVNDMMEPGAKVINTEKESVRYQMGLKSKVRGRRAGKLPIRMAHHLTVPTDILKLIQRTAA